MHSTLRLESFHAQLRHLLLTKTLGHDNDMCNFREYDLRNCPIFLNIQDLRRTNDGHKCYIRLMPNRSVGGAFPVNKTNKIDKRK